MMFTYEVTIDKEMLRKYNRNIFQQFYNVNWANFFSMPLLGYIISLLIDLVFDIYWFLILFVVSEIPLIWANIRSIKYTIHKPVKYCYEFHEESLKVTTSRKKEKEETVTLLYGNIEKIYQNDLYLILIGSHHKKYVIDKLSFDKEKYLPFLTKIKSYISIKEIR